MGSFIRRSICISIILVTAGLAPAGAEEAANPVDYMEMQYEEVLKLLKSPDIRVCEAAAYEVDRRHRMGNAVPELKHMDLFRELLDSPVARVREHSANAIGYIQDPAVVPVLINALQNRDATVRSITAQKLGGMGERSAVGPLVQALKDADPHVRYSAADALGKIRDTQSIPALQVALDYPGEDARCAKEGGFCEDTRQAAAGALCLFKQSDVLPALLKAAGNRSSRVRLTVLHTLKNWYGRDVDNALISALRDPDAAVREVIAQSLGSREDPAAVPALIAATKDRTAAVRAAAVQSLGEIGDARGYDAIIGRLRDPDQNVHLAAMYAVRRSGDRHFTASLTGLATDTDGFRRMNAVDMLSQLLPGTEVSKLVPFLKDRDPRVRNLAMNILASMGRKEAVPLLKKILRESFDDYECSTLAVYLRDLGDAVFIAEFRKDLWSRDVKVALRAIRLFRSLGLNDAAPDLVKLAGDRKAAPEVRKEAVNALGDIRNPAAVPTLIECLADPAPVVRLSAAWALGQLGDARAAAPLVRAAETGDNELKAQAISALGALGDRSAVPALMKWYLDPALEGFAAAGAGQALVNIGDTAIVPEIITAMAATDPLIRSRAAFLLGQVPGPGSREALIRALSDSEPGVRNQAASALGNTGREECVAPLMALASDPSDYVRQAAVLSLGQLRDARAVPVLIKALDDPDPLGVVNGNAVWSLVRIKDEQSSKAISDFVIRNVRKNPDRVSAALEDLINSESSVPFDMLVYVLKNGDDRSKKSAVQLLGLRNEDSVMQLLHQSLGDDTVYNDVETAAAEALARRGDARGMEALVKINRELWPLYYEPLLSLAALPPSPELYRQFARTKDSVIFNMLRNSSAPNAEGIALVTASEQSFTKAAGEYLQSLLHREKGETGKQKEAADRALKQLDVKRHTALAILCLWSSAQADVKSGLHAEALASADRAWRLCRLLGVRERWDYEDLFEEQTLFLKGEILAASGDGRAARDSYERALSRCDGLRAKWKAWTTKQEKDRVEKLAGMVRASLGILQIKEGRQNLLWALEVKRMFPPANSVEMENEEKLYAELARQSIADGKLDEAQKLLEELNLRRAQFMERGMKVRLADTAKQERIDEYRGREDELKAVEEKIAGLVKKQGGKSLDGDARKELDRLASERDGKKRALNLYLTKLKRSHPDLAALLGARPIELAALQDRLPEDAAILQYLVLPDRVTLFVIRKGSIDIVETPVKRDDLKKTAEDYIRAVRDRAPDETLGNLSAMLYGRLIAPVEQAGMLKGISVLGISPNNFLHYVPFAALSDGKTYLADTHTLFFINSTSLMSVAADRAGSKTGGGGRLLAFGNPDGSLIGAEREVEAIGKNFSDRTVLKRKDANKQALAGVSDATVVHFATHGVLNTRDATKSYLVMSRSRKPEDNLSVEEIWGLPLSRTGLTVLSACETGVGELMSGDDMVSLENAFIYAGSPSVVASLWKVDDAATTALMEAFYRGMSKGAGPAEALRSAQKELRAKTESAHPYFWAAFTLRGWWK